MRPWKNILLLNIDREEVEEDGALELQATYGKEIEWLRRGVKIFLSKLAE
jgi:hypothetical protein